jgi:hypothetical protein
MAPKQEYPVTNSAKWLNWWRSKEPIRTAKVEKWTPTDGNGQKPQRTGQGIASRKAVYSGISMEYASMPGTMFFVTETPTHAINPRQTPTLLSLNAQPPLPSRPHRRNREQPSTSGHLRSSLPVMTGLTHVHGAWDKSAFMKQPTFPAVARHTHLGLKFPGSRSRPALTTKECVSMMTRPSLTSVPGRQDRRRTGVANTE